MSDITCLRTRKHRRAWERAIRRLARRAARHAGVAVVPSLLPLIALLVAPPALALPLGGQVASGNVTIGAPAPNTMAITQGTPKGIVNWNSFSIGANETVNIAQPSAQAVLLNRVVGSQASTIAGRMNANGQVFLVNPAGVLFARGASINVGSLVASTLGISDSDFLAGRYRFAGASPQAGGRVVNQGSITAGERGTVALLGAQVDNSGTVSAKLGTVAMGAGSDITLDFAGDGLTMLKVNGRRAGADVGADR
jgi:filamentous hemagglutinin family protein